MKFVKCIDNPGIYITIDKIYQVKKEVIKFRDNKLKELGI